MPFRRQPPPSPTSATPSHSTSPPQHPSSSSRPSLSSKEHPTPESEGLLRPLQRLSLQDDLHSQLGKRKHEIDSDSTSVLPQERAAELERRKERMWENMSDKEYRQDVGSSIRNDVDRNLSREAPSHPHPPLSSSRPSLPHRNSSYSKRHASFDTPREIPLPYMPHRQPSSTSAAQSTAVVHDSEPASRLSCLTADSRTDVVRSVFDDSVAGSSSDTTSSTSSSPPMFMGGDSKAAWGSVPDFTDLTESSTASRHFHPSCSVQHPRPQSPRAPSSSPNTLSLFSRPLSSPEASRPICSPRPMRPPGVPDRGSTASLPLPADTPYHTLPAFPSGTIQEDQEMRSAAPTRPNSSRPSAGPSRASTSSIPSSSSWQVQRSPSLPSDLEHEEFMSLVASRILDRVYSSVTRMASPDRELSPPAPPTVLTPPPPPLSQGQGPATPYEPFLAHAPAPQDSYIAVDTRPAEYRVVVRLQDFKRDAITVSTRKRRILHIAADSWEPNGGHFEQRISFGYDALLAQVRAEFDGEHLQVIVPRRTVPMM